MKIFDTSWRGRSSIHERVEANFDIHFQNEDKELSVLKKEFEDYIKDMGHEELFDDFDTMDLIKFMTEGPYLAELEKIELQRSLNKKFKSGKSTRL